VFCGRRHALNAGPARCSASTRSTARATERAAPLLDIVEEEGGDVRRTILGHMDRTGAEPDLQVGLLERGVTIEYDLFGYEQSHANWQREPPSDRLRILDVKRLIDAGSGTGWSSRRTSASRR
jgi:predicted metal-dependent phosphotriesterase family hydrolase